MNCNSQFLTLRGLPIALCLLFLAAVASAQTVVRSFDGDKGPGLATCESGVTHCDRPEMDVATNGKLVVQVTWQNVRVYKTNGRLLRSIPMTTFIRNAGLNPVSFIPHMQNSTTPPGPYEPHIVYDEFINRWIITVTGQNDSLLVSASPDPMGSWGGVYPSCREAHASAWILPSTLATTRTVCTSARFIPVTTILIQSRASHTTASLYRRPKFERSPRGSHPHTSIASTTCRSTYTRQLTTIDPNRQPLRRSLRPRPATGQR
jgi:hypothetical protein